MQLVKVLVSTQIKTTNLLSVRFHEIGEILLLKMKVTGVL